MCCDIWYVFWDSQTKTTTYRFVYTDINIYIYIYIYIYIFIDPRTITHIQVCINVCVWLCFLVEQILDVDQYNKDFLVMDPNNKYSLYCETTQQGFPYYVSQQSGFLERSKYLLATHVGLDITLISALVRRLCSYWGPVLADRCEITIKTVWNALWFLPWYEGRARTEVRFRRIVVLLLNVPLAWRFSQYSLCMIHILVYVVLLDS